MSVNKTLEQLEVRIDVLEKRIASLEQTPGGGEEKSRPIKEISLKEFMLQKGPKDDVQKTLAIGYFLEKYRKEPSFNVKNLEDGFREAKEKVPQNINDKVNLNIKKGQMMDVAEKKDNLTAWTITNSGEKYVEDSFTKERSRC